jgi:hypothetical protein
MTAPDDFASRIAAAYATDGPSVELGRAVLAGTTYPTATVQLPAAMCNRHGLIAGATGTGKTKTLQLMAEQLSAMGVAVFAADMKGDLSGLRTPGTGGDKLEARRKELDIEWAPAGYPVEFLSLGGAAEGAAGAVGVPVRATIGSFGPQLLAKVLDCNETQTSSLALVFHYADSTGLALLDLCDLRAVLQYLTSDDGKAELKQIGGLSPATVGVLLRKLVELEAQGGEEFFGEPELEVSDLIRQTADGRGVISCLELKGVQDKPKLFSTFLMWLLAELFQELPEVGDLDQPKLVFFFDEAHLLFADAPKEFVEQVAQTVRLIRSKGIGVFFVTQLPDDVPDEILAQLGNRVQHALRAFTPRDAKALKAAVTTYPETKDYDLEEDLTQLGIGEAMVTILSDKGAPTPVVWTKLRPPTSLMAAVEAGAIDSSARASDLWPKYAEEIDRESARERLAAKMEAGAPETDDPETDDPETDDPEADAPEREAAKPAARQSRAKATQPEGKTKDENAVVGYLKGREGRSMINTVARGVFGLLKKRR